MKYNWKVILALAILLVIVLAMILAGGDSAPYFSQNLFPSHDKTILINGSLDKALP